MHALSREQELIIICARLNAEPLAQKITSVLHDGVDWDKLMEIADRQKITPFLYFNLNRIPVNGLLPGIPEKIKLAYLTNLYKNTLVEKEMLPFLEAARAQKLKLIAIKGLALSRALYTDPAIRTMCDVDILIREEDRRPLAEILSRIGYQGDFAQLANGCRFKDQLIFSKETPLGQFMLDVHWTFFSSRPYKIDLPLAWERSQVINIDGQELLILSEEDTLLSLALHIRRHVRNITLNSIVDVAELLNLHSPHLDWAYIKREAGRNHFLLPVYFSLYLAKEILDANFTDAVLNKFRPNIVKRKIISVLINKSNFFDYNMRKGSIIRFLLFDGLIDFFVYLWRVSFVEKFVFKNKLDE